MLETGSVIGAVGFPAGPVNSIAEAFAAAHPLMN
jgi:hypothetical protein